LLLLRVRANGTGAYSSWRLAASTRSKESRRIHHAVADTGELGDEIVEVAEPEFVEIGANLRRLIEIECAYLA